MTKKKFIKDLKEGFVSIEKYYSKNYDDLIVYYYLIENNLRVFPNNYKIENFESLKENFNLSTFIYSNQKSLNIVEDKLKAIYQDTCTWVNNNQQKIGELLQKHSSKRKWIIGKIIFLLIIALIFIVLTVLEKIFKLENLQNISDWIGMSDAVLGIAFFIYELYSDNKGIKNSDESNLLDNSDFEKQKSPIQNIKIKNMEGSAVGDNNTVNNN